MIDKHLETKIIGAFDIKNLKARHPFNYDDSSAAITATFIMIARLPQYYLEAPNSHFEFLHLCLVKTSNWQKGLLVVPIHDKEGSGSTTFVDVTPVEIPSEINDIEAALTDFDLGYQASEMIMHEKSFSFDLYLSTGRTQMQYTVSAAGFMESRKLTEFYRYLYKVVKVLEAAHNSPYISQFIRYHDSWHPLF